jgi:hypothetical protein
MAHMPRQKGPIPQTLEVPQGQRIVIAGQPENLRGSFYIHNTGTERVLLRSLPLSTRDKALAATRIERKAEEFKPSVRIRPGMIRPGQTGPVSLSLSLDPYTPPGEYQAEVEVAGKLQSVVILVTEKVSLRVSPSELVIENLPGQKITKRVVFTNHGNIPLHIGEFGAIYLDDELLICRTLRAAAAAVDDELRPLEEYLATILLQGKHVAESSGILRVHNLTGDINLQPGETQPVDLEIRVPEGLDKRGRFRGVFALYTTSLSLVIVPSSGPAAPEDSAPRTRRAGKKGSS